MVVWDQTISRHGLYLVIDSLVVKEKVHTQKRHYLKHYKDEW